MLIRARIAIQSGNAPRRLWDFLFAQALFALSSSVRRKLFAGEKYYCPVCETYLRKFLVLHRPYHRFCPVCRSLQRHRLVWVFLIKWSVISQQHSQRLLHFAPESGLTQKLAKITGIHYFSADLVNPEAMTRINITQIPFPSNTFDIILCSHVLEHVTDDRKALDEIYRVLKPNGQAIIIVPVKGSVTREDPTLTDPFKREKLFGQFDHVRVYGYDIEFRLRQAGFDIKVLTTEDVAKPEEIEQMGLEKQEILFVCHKK